MKKRTVSSIRIVYANHVIKLTELFFKSETPKQGEIDIHQAQERSTRTLGSYVTLDWDHRISINRLCQTIQNYSIDTTQRRPLNIIMLAEPGSGKTHFVKCLADKLKDDNVAAVSYNMGTMQHPDDLIQPLEVSRNLKVQDILPILFIDEFDSDFKNFPLLLPLLWDGEIHIGHRELKMGKLIIILAGSNPKIIERIKNIQKMEKLSMNSSESDKLIDLLSRINGGLFEIPNLDRRKTDKICLTISLLQKRFGKNLKLAPWSLLKFIGETKFRYGVRSIALLIDSIPYSADISEKITVQDLMLPFTSENVLKKSNLAYHIIPSENDNDISGIINRWNKISQVETLVRFKEAEPLEE